MTVEWRAVPRFDPSKAFAVDPHKNARRSDPQTSRDGATRIKRTDRDAVYATYQQVGLRGLTDRELRSRCPSPDLERQESWRKRRSDLSREHLLVSRGERRGGQLVWLVPPEGAQPTLGWD